MALESDDRACVTQVGTAGLRTYRVIRLSGRATSHLSQFFLADEVISKVCLKMKCKLLNERSKIGPVNGPYDRPIDLSFQSPRSCFG
jgi:hypothetical protein